MSPAQKVAAPALFLTLALGIVSRLHPIGFALYDKSLGDALYAVMVFLVVTLVWRAGGLRIRAAVALAICLSLEVFQATGIPARVDRVLPVAHWVLGTTFAWHDVGCYIVGVAAALAMARAITTRAAAK